MLSGAFPCYLYVVGQRVEQRDPLAEHPQQSDYAVAWTGDDSALTPKVRRLPDMPLPVAQAYEWLRLLLNRPSESGLNAVRLDRLAQDIPQARG
jgi:hypothetical protein